MTRIAFFQSWHFLLTNLEPRPSMLLVPANAQVHVASGHNHSCVIIATIFIITLLLQCWTCTRSSGWWDRAWTSWSETSPTTKTNWCKCSARAQPWQISDEHYIHRHCRLACSFIPNQSSPSISTHIVSIVFRVEFFQWLTYYTSFRTDRSGFLGNAW